MTLDQKAQAVDMYKNGIGSSTIAKRLGFSKPSILSLLKRSGITTRSHVDGQRLRHRKYFNNDTFFDSIDTAEKAYVLGFFAADGCNFPKSKNVNFVCCDLDVLEKIKVAMGVDCPIKAPKPAKPHYKPCYVLRIKSQHMCSRLEELGYGPRKSFTCGWPKDLPAHFESHFIRGYFDGDGTVSCSLVNGHVMPSYGFVGSQAFITEVVKRFDIQFCIRAKSSIYNAISGSKKNLNVFFNYLYHESTIHMDRKYNKFSDIMRAIS